MNWQPGDVNFLEGARMGDGWQRQEKAENGEGISENKKKCVGAWMAARKGLLLRFGVVSPRLAIGSNGAIQPLPTANQ